jgi:hypothetical protein
LNDKIKIFLFENGKVMDVFDMPEHTLIKIFGNKIYVLDQNNNIQILKR